MPEQQGLSLSRPVSGIKYQVTPRASVGSGVFVLTLGYVHADEGGQSCVQGTAVGRGSWDVSACACDAEEGRWDSGVSLQEGEQECAYRSERVVVWKHLHTRRCKCDKISLTFI